MGDEYRMLGRDVVKCMSCWFYGERPGQELADEFGECRFNAPRTSSPVRWPRVRPTEHCGEWRTMEPRLLSETSTGHLAIGARI